MAKSRFTSHLKPYMAAQAVELDRDAASMAANILKTATVLAPIDTGALRKDGRIMSMGTGWYRIIFGSDSVPYARRRHFENKKNPGTLNYLERAGQAAERQPQKYIRKRK